LAKHYYKFKQIYEFCILVPAKPNTPTKISSTSSSILLKWNGVLEGTVSKSYKIAWRSAFHNTNKSATTRSTTFRADNLKSNTAFVFKITAMNEAGFGAPSDSTTYATSKLIDFPTL